MSKEIILKVENLSKQYRLGVVDKYTLRDDLKKWWYRIRGKEDPFLKVGEVNDRSQEINSEYVWALKDINFEVQKGEVLGIIGANGAGKSTLLKILSKITTPTEGSVKYKGLIASLLEVGTGFHGELTGRENIYLNGAILGMTKDEITSKMDAIIEFSGCEGYIDTPVKRYSSGMGVRLGFAVAAFLEPDILIVDEVLAVGDAEFQKKAIGKMQDISRGKNGQTVLFVSHNMQSVKNLCTRAIVMEKGGISFKGSTIDCLNFYQKIDKKNITMTYRSNSIIKYATINAVNNIIKYNSELNLHVDFKSNIEIKDLVLGIVIKDINGVELMGVNNKHYHYGKLNSSKIFEGKIVLTINNNKFLPGIYIVDLFLGDSKVDIEIVKNALKFEVIENHELNLVKQIDYKINKIFQNEIVWKLY